MRASFWGLDAFDRRVAAGLSIPPPARALRLVALLIAHSGDSLLWVLAAGVAVGASLAVKVASLPLLLPLGLALIMAARRRDGPGVVECVEGLARCSTNPNGTASEATAKRWTGGATMIRPGVA